MTGSGSCVCVCGGALVPGRARRVILTWSRGLSWEIEMKDDRVVRSLEFEPGCES